MARIVVRELDISEFRGIKKLSKPIKLRSFNVIVGRNNVGKTSILEALYLLNHPEHYDFMLGTTCAAVLADLHSGFESLVYGYHGKAELAFQLEGGYVVNIDIQHDGKTQLQLGAQKLTMREYRDILSKKYREYRIFALYIPDKSEAYRRIYDVVVKSRDVWRFLVKHGLHHSVVEKLIVPTVYDRFTEVLLEENSLKIRKEVKDGLGPFYIDVRDLGEGVERTLLVALAVEYAKPLLILWDDVEVALHPTLVNAVIEWLSSADAQVVLTSHSLDVLYALTRVYPEDAQVILLKKSVDDEVYHEALTLEELEELIERHLDPHKLAEALEL